MCTVTYVPRSGGGFYLNSNRDESPSRAAEGLVQIMPNGKKIVFPKDRGAGGTWIAANEEGMVLCLLNGGFEPHERKLPYRMSRGIVLLELLETPDIPKAFSQYNLEGIEPFTLVLAGWNTLWDLRWDGNQRHLRPINAGGSHIWSSVTLYDDTVRSRREKWFRAWEQAHTKTDLEKMLTFHLHAGEGDPRNDVAMNRNGLVQTISVTRIVHLGQKLEMHYFDLLTQRKERAQIELNRELVEPGATSSFLD
ncbi:MAG: NRDE family protein [Haliscomenobacter sp.]|nr:NRDE family protein [Haliscomenobacter sp.]